MEALVYTLDSTIAQMEDQLRALLFQPLGQAAPNDVLERRRTLQTMPPVRGNRNPKHHVAKAKAKSSIN